MAETKYPTEPPDSPEDNEPDTVATPEGDNEYPPDQPLPNATEPTPERPRGNEPHPSQPLRDARVDAIGDHFDFNGPQ